MTKINGQTFKTIIELDNAVEKLVGEEINSYKETAENVYNFSTDNFKIEICVESNLYNGLTVKCHDITGGI